jgi:hypothetical protein
MNKLPENYRQFFSIKGNRTDYDDHAFLAVADIANVRVGRIKKQNIIKSGRLNLFHLWNS